MTDVFFQSFLNVAFALGMLGLVRWLPLPLQRVFIVRPLERRSPAEHIAGVVGVFCYLAQIARLFFVEFDWLVRQLPGMRSAVIAAVVIAVTLFGSGVVHFIWVLAHYPRATGSSTS
jgi:hypothetical protein